MDNFELVVAVKSNFPLRFAVRVALQSCLPDLNKVTYPRGRCPPRSAPVFWSAPSVGAPPHSGHLRLPSPRHPCISTSSASLSFYSSSDTKIFQFSISDHISKESHLFLPYASHNLFSCSCSLQDTLIGSMFRL